ASAVYNTCFCVKKHHHKHNLKHRYELLETLGKGTYGKVKKAIERQSGKVVSSRQRLTANETSVTVGSWCVTTSE
uniref:Protein kinase domain-containing protein n=1 Tax=Hucho hucho TaxID=62062 RepID=A0A4W5MTK1_9TELE